MRKAISMEWVGPPPGIFSLNRGELPDLTSHPVLVKYSDGSSEQRVFRYWEYDGIKPYRKGEQTGFVRLDDCALPLNISYEKEKLTGVKVSRQGKSDYSAGESADAGGFLGEAFFSDGSSKSVRFQCKTGALDVGDTEMVLVYGCQTINAPVTVRAGAPAPKTPESVGADDFSDSPSQAATEPARAETIPTPTGEERPVTKTPIAADDLFEDDLFGDEVAPEPDRKEIPPAGLGSEPELPRDVPAVDDAPADELPEPNPVPVDTPAGGPGMTPEAAAPAPAETNRSMGQSEPKADAVVASIAAISVAVPPRKQKYLLGDLTPNLAGGILDVMYSDGTVRQIAMSDSMEAAPGSVDIGNTVMTVRMFGLVATYPISVIEPRAVKVVVKKPQDKTEYEEGEMLDLHGLVLDVLFNDDEVHVVNGLDVQYELSRSDASVSLNYMGIPFEVPVTVRKKGRAVTPVSLELSKLPDKLVYAQDEKNFVGDGGELLVQMSNGHREPISFSDIEIHGFDTGSCGERELTAVYMGLEYRFNVTVKEKTLTGIRVEGFRKNSYFAGEPYDFVGVIVFADYDNKTSAPISDYAVNKRVAELGDTFLVFSSHGKTASVSVSVSERCAAGVRFKRLPLRRNYSIGDREIFCEGGVLEVLYDDNTSSFVPLEACWLRPFSLSRPGSTELYVEYSGFVVPFTVMVEEPRETGIEISSMPRTTYTNGEVFDSSNLVVSVLYSNGSKRQLSRTEYRFQINRPLAQGDTYILVIYKLFGAIIPISVLGSRYAPPMLEAMDATVVESEAIDVSSSAVPEDKPPIPIIPQVPDDFSAPPVGRPVRTESFYPSTARLRF